MVLQTNAIRHLSIILRRCARGTPPFFLLYGRAMLRREKRYWISLACLCKVLVGGVWRKFNVCGFVCLYNHVNILINHLFLLESIKKSCQSLVGLKISRTFALLLRNKPTDKLKNGM